MHRRWLQHLDYCRDHKRKCMIWAHWGSGKTSTLAVPLSAWLIGRDPNVRIKFITNDDTSAKRRVAGVARLVESATYRAIFPEVQAGNKWTEHEFFVRRTGHAIDPTIEARGVFTTGVGGRTDFLVFDDVVDQLNAADQVQRKKVLDFVENTWIQRLSPTGGLLYIATPWHLDDASHHFMNAHGWCSLVQRVSDDCSKIEQTVLGAEDDYPGLR